MSEKKSKEITRRDFLGYTVRTVAALAAGGLGLSFLDGKETVWQIDPDKCVQCGKCADYCVVTPSAVKCMHSFAMCGFCDLCGGYYKSNVKVLNTASESMICPTKAITRKYVEEPYFEYTIDDKLCIGCGKCVKGCTSFGNGSLFLQIKQNLCVGCNECNIARHCPSKAITRVPAGKPYYRVG